MNDNTDMHKWVMYLINLEEWSSKILLMENWAIGP